MISYKYTLTILSLITLVTSVSQAKSLYVINDTETSELQAYRIEDANLVHQANYDFFSETWGPVGIAIDESSYGQFLFVTFETANKIELVNAKTMQYVDTVEAVGASDLAGIVVDHNKQKVYTVDRRTPNLYVYSWYPLIPQLVLDEQIELEGLIYGDVGGAWGLALDEENGRLWVTSNETTVRFYNTSDWSHNPNTDYITLSQKAVGIALDLANQYVYSGNGTGGGGNTYLSQYDLSDNNEPTVDVGSSVLGIAVNQDTGYVYITTHGSGSSPDRIVIYDSNLVKQSWESGDIGNPAGVAVAGDVSYKPPRFYLEKHDVNEPNAVFPEDYITYEITYGPNGCDHNNVVITDYLPDEVYPDNPLDPNYDPNNRTYTWNIGSLDAGAPNDSVTLTVQVNYLAEPTGKIRNYCEIENDLYCSFATADTNVCCWGGNIIYVDQSATAGFNIGTSWANAYLDLQDALDRADAGCGNQIWVAEGTYKPDEDSNNPDGTGDREATFQLVNGVAIYGGFPSGGGVRRPNIHHTTLSGDIGTGNSYHVIKCENISNVVIDGFTIQKGSQANIEINNGSPTIRNNTIKESGGHGIYCNNSDPNIINCLIAKNGEYGSGIYCSNSSPTITNCIFSGNKSYYGGGGIYNCWSSSPNITNCIFIGNSAYYSLGAGGGIRNDGSSPTITNCTFRGNSTNGYGGGMCNIDNSSPEVTNCIFWGNYARVDGNEIYNYDDDSDPTFSFCDINDCGAPDSWDVNLGINGGGNIEADPCFYDANDPNSYHLTTDSPCIDKGDNSSVPPDTTDLDGDDNTTEPIPWDIDGQGRIIDGDSKGTEIVDIGADEYYWNPPDFKPDGIVNFLDYAIFANAWQSDPNDPNWNPDCDLDPNSIIDNYDLDLFCDEWLVPADWYHPVGSMMGQGMGQGMGQTTVGYSTWYPSLGLTEASYSSAVVEQQPAQLTQVDIEELLKWLDELWLDPEVREVISEDEWLEFMESVASELE